MSEIQECLMPHRQTLSHDTTLLHASWSTELPHVVAVNAVAALLPAAGDAAFTPHPSAPQRRDGGAFSLWTVGLVQGRRQARTVQDGRRNRWGLIPCRLGTSDIRELAAMSSHRQSVS